MRLADDPGDETAPPAVAARCCQSWAEMLGFLAGTTRTSTIANVGTIAWLIAPYQTDPDSPYRALRQSMQARL